MKSLVKTLSVGAVFAVVVGAFSVQAEDNSVAANTAPVGQTCLQGQPCASAVAASSGGAARSGEQVYNASCHTCHATGAANAPKLGDAAAWNPRLAARNKEGLYKSAENGFNGMPPKGLCMDCSADELKGAVDYMLKKIGK
ncbi:MAG: cytochrome c5 family protein [Pseudomonadales bacterium]|nr:cytochrome c5 family protein [Pseudomonadales bacterium]